MSISADQLAALKAKIQTLSDDKDAADVATAKSNDADAAATRATADAATAKLTEQGADATVAADLVDLTSFVESLSAPVPVPATPS